MIVSDLCDQHDASHMALAVDDLYGLHVSCRLSSSAHTNVMVRGYRANKALANGHRLGCSRECALARTGHADEITKEKCSFDGFL
jgi:hypothetical protein